MKKIAILLLILTTLTACWNNETQKDNKSNYNQTNNKELNINVKEKVEQAKKELEDIWLTWQELKDKLYEQEIAYKQLANLSWDAKNSYILQNQVLPEVLKTPQASKCKNTTNIDLFVQCMVRQWINLDDIKNQLPQETQETFEKKYYKKFYSFDKRNLLKENSNPIAIEQKKDEVFSLIQNDRLTKNMCKDLPEEEVRNYCISLFEEEK